MIRYGIAGFGLHAVKRLMPGFQQAQRCRVSALSRRDPAKAREAAAKYGIPLAFSSIDELCASPEVDAVLVTTPNSCHLADVLAAARHRKPVLCEKPMALNAEECRQMIATAREAGVLLGVAQIFRFCPSLHRLRERISSGEIGRVVFARAEFSFWGKQHARTWMGDRAISGGGPIADVGVHCIDALRFVLQDEVEAVSAVGSADELSGEVEAVAALNLRFARGTLATVLVSTRAQYRTPLEFVGETGVLRADDGLNVERPITMELRRDGKPANSEQVSNVGAYAVQVDAFADAIEGRATFPVLGEEGLKNQLVLDAAYRSLESGRMEKVSSF
ncbi:MAG TPA: Gfo/Idh/MocA family oxidoreductase, partial [Terriglobales bacterium]|nr:Gfo/Idh/MocA family oxidoreductase [Terriglobales bacterium]